MPLAPLSLNPPRDWLFGGAARLGARGGIGLCVLVGVVMVVEALSGVGDVFWQGEPPVSEGGADCQRVLWTAVRSLLGVRGCERAR